MIKYSSRGMEAFRAVRHRRGSVAIQVGVMLTVLIGAVGLGTEIPFALSRHRQLQIAADTAAVSAAATKFETGSVAALTEARAIAAASGFTHGQDGITVELARPPTSGTYAGVTDAVEVTIRQPLALTLAKVLGLSSFDVGVRAVAKQGLTGAYCILALETAASDSFDLKASATLPSAACGAASNSISESALVLGSASSIMGNTSVRGGVSKAGNAQLAGDYNINHRPAIVDPYLDVAAAPVLPCTAQKSVLANNATLNLTPARFCSGWLTGTGSTLNLAPGVYVIDRQLILGANTTVNAKDGVTLIVNGDYAMSIGSNVAMGITAPTTGPYAGIAMMSGPSATTTINHQFQQTVKLDITGAFYFPSQILTLKTGLSASSGCSQAIARLIRIEQSVPLGNICAGKGTREITGGSISALVQ